MVNLGKGMLVRIKVALYADAPLGAIGHISKVDPGREVTLYEVRGKLFTADEIEFYLRKPGDNIDINA